MKTLIIYENYTREEVHDIFAPNTRFTPSAGTWGLHGIVKIHEQPGDFVFFVTYGQRQADHQFQEWVSEDGILSWQSQPRHTLASPVIQQFINHDETKNSIYLFLRTEKGNPYTYLGRLKYVSHDPTLEKPVYILWKILDWENPEFVLKRMGFHLRENANVELISSLGPRTVQSMSSTDTSHQSEIMSFVWRGYKYDVNSYMLLSTIRDHLSRHLPPEATRFVHWYVEIDGHFVSPKWVFHLITGAGYDEFDSPTARSKLKQVGLASQQVSKEYLGQATVANPDRRNAFYREIAKILPGILNEKYRRCNIKALKSKGQLEIHYPEFPPKAYYVIYRRKELDQIAFWYIESKENYERFVQQLSEYQNFFSTRLGMQVRVGRHWERMAMGRIAVDILANQRKFPDIPTLTLNKSEAEWYANVMASLIDATYDPVFKIIGETFKNAEISQKRTKEVTAKNEKPKPISPKKKAKKINNATHFAISQFLSDLWQVGEIANDTLTKKYGLRDYHYNLLIQSGLISWNPESMVITPKFIELLAQRINTGNEKPSVMSLLGINNVRDWDEFHSKTFFREVDIISQSVGDVYLSKPKTPNIWDDPVSRPCILIDYLNSPAEERGQVDPSDWNIDFMMRLDPIFLENKRYIHSTLPIGNGLDPLTSIQNAIWENPFFALGIQLTILSDPQTGGVYEYKTSLVLLDGFNDNGKLNLYMNGDYVCDLRDILNDMFINFRWDWINKEEDFIKVFMLLNKIGVLEKERDGRVVFTDEFRDKLFLKSSTQSHNFRQTRPYRAWLRELLKQHMGRNNV